MQTITVDLSKLGLSNEFDITAQVQAVQDSKSWRFAPGTADDPDAMSWAPITVQANGEDMQLEVWRGKDVDGHVAYNVYTEGEVEKALESHADGELTKEGLAAGRGLPTRQGGEASGSETHTH